MSIPTARPPSPALPVAAAVVGVTYALTLVLFALVRAHALGLTPWDEQRIATLITMGGRAAKLSGMLVAAAAAISLARSRRSAGASLAAAAFVVGVIGEVVELVVTWTWPWADAARGWRAETAAILSWVQCTPELLATVGLSAAGWRDRGIRLLAPGTVGAAMMVGAPPPLSAWAFSLVEDASMWIVPGILAAASLAWAFGFAMIALRLPPIPGDTVAPRPPAPALRRFAIAAVAMVVIGLAAGVAIAFAQGKPAADMRPLALVIPIAVAIVTAGVGAALTNIAVADVAPRAARFAGFGATCVFWCVAVVAMQTLSSHRPRPTGGASPVLFAVFEPPWMPGMVGAIVAALALVAMSGMLASAARQAGQPSSRAQSLVVVLALAIGALTTPWVLGFGTRRHAMDSLQIATLASAVVVNLVAWFALARAAWRTAATFERR